MGCLVLMARRPATAASSASSPWGLGINGTESAVKTPTSTHQPVSRASCSSVSGSRDRRGSRSAGPGSAASGRDPHFSKLGRGALCPGQLAQNRLLGLGIGKGGGRGGLGFPAPGREEKRAVRISRACRQPGGANPSRANHTLGAESLHQPGCFLSRFAGLCRSHGLEA